MVAAGYMVLNWPARLDMFRRRSRRIHEGGEWQVLSIQCHGLFTRQIFRRICTYSRSRATGLCMACRASLRHLRPGESQANQHSPAREASSVDMVMAHIAGVRPANCMMRCRA